MRNVIYANFKNKPAVILQRCWKKSGESFELEKGQRVAFFWGADGLPYRLSIFAHSREVFLDLERPGEPVQLGGLIFRRVAVRWGAACLQKKILIEISEVDVACRTTLESSRQS